MARYFLDSSALVKHYHQESGSSTVDELFNTTGNRFFVSRLALVEIHSTFARLVREAIITETDFDKLIAGGLWLNGTRRRRIRCTPTTALLVSLSPRLPLCRAVAKNRC